MCSTSLPSMSSGSLHSTCLGSLRVTEDRSLLPESLDDASGSSSDSDSTLEDDEIFANIGHPLERFVRTGRSGSNVSINFEQFFGYDPTRCITTIRSPCSPSCSQAYLPVTSSCIDFQNIINTLLNAPSDPFDALDSQDFVTYVSSSPNSSPFASSLLVKRIYKNSLELSLLLELNAPNVRQDPWNPSPRVLQVVDHDAGSEYVYLCLERLGEYNKPPMSTVAQYIDFFRQILEGLTFLHENRIAGFRCFDPGSYMVDLSSGSHPNSSASSFLDAYVHARVISTPQRVDSQDDTSRCKDSHEGDFQSTGEQYFNRSTHPVKYYFVNFSHAQYIHDSKLTVEHGSSTPSSSPSSSSSMSQSGAASESERLSTGHSQKHLTSSTRFCPFRKDVQEMSVLIGDMLLDLPNVTGSKFKSLITAMTVGAFRAEDARKLLEALCRSLESRVFEMKVTPKS